MRSGQLTAIIIVAIIMFASIMRARFGGPYRRRHFGRGGDDQTQVENRHLREEVLELKERIKVLERITVEKENSLSREIDSLRDR